MDTLTPTDLTTLRNLLAQRLQALESEVQADESARRPAALAHEVTDLEEQAARSAEDSVLEAQEQRDVDELEQVRGALKRLAEGTFGECVQCGEAIALQRLLAEPSAARCPACQSALERNAARVR